MQEKLINVQHNKLNLILPTREQSPYVNRVRLMWQKMREPILKQFPAAPGPPSDIDSYLKATDDIYVTDAYHSLSIEGYRVSPELIERVMGGESNPDENQDDREYRNVLAARGSGRSIRRFAIAYARCWRAIIPELSPMMITATGTVKCLGRA